MHARDRPCRHVKKKSAPSSGPARALLLEPALVVVGVGTEDRKGSKLFLGTACLEEEEKEEDEEDENDGDEEEEEDEEAEEDSASLSLASSAKGSESLSLASASATLSAGGGGERMDGEGDLTGESSQSPILTGFPASSPSHSPSPPTPPEPPLSSEPLLARRCLLLFFFFFCFFASLPFDEVAASLRLSASSKEWAAGTWAVRWPFPPKRPERLSASPRLFSRVLYVLNFPFMLRGHKATN